MLVSLDKHAARVTWTVMLMVAGVGLAYLARRTLFVFAIALLFAYMLAPLVKLVDRITPRRVPRTVSLAMVYLLLLVALGFAGSALGSKISEEATSFAARWPELVERTQSWQAPAWLEPVRVRAAGYFRGLLDNGAEQLVPYLREAGGHVFALLGNVLFVVLIPILSFFFLKDGREMRDALLVQMVDPARHRVLDDILADLHLLLGQYIRALVLLSLATFIFYMLVLSVLGVPYSVLLAGIAAPLEFIPVVGPLTAAAITLTVAAVSGYPHVLWVLVFLAVYRLFQDYVLNPYLMSAGVEVHPVLVLFGVLAGEQVAGVPGMFFSVPVIAALRVVYVRMQRWRIVTAATAAAEGDLRE